MSWPPPQELRDLGHLRADAVINQLTAMSGPPTRYEDLVASDRIRVVGTRNLLILARRAGATRFLTQSFLGGYGYLDHRPLLRQRGSDRIDERYPFDGPAGNPQLEATVGAVREAERLTFTAAGIDEITLRYGLFYGADLAWSPLPSACRLWLSVASPMPSLALPSASSALLLILSSSPIGPPFMLGIVVAESDTRGSSAQSQVPAPGRSVMCAIFVVDARARNPG
jgi:hypothetical protein